MIKNNDVQIIIANESSIQIINTNEKKKTENTTKTLLINNTGLKDWKQIESIIVKTNQESITLVTQLF